MASNRIWGVYYSDGTGLRGTVQAANERDALRGALAAGFRSATVKPTRFAAANVSTGGHRLQFIGPLA